jgi:hypothetical protein
MKTPVVVVSLSLTLAIVVVALLLILTQAGALTPDTAPRHIGAEAGGPHHLWKMKNAPATMKAKPIA